MSLSTEQQILVEQRVTNEAKSAGVAYLLLIFLGGLGVHRFYLGKTGSGAAILVLSILGFLTVAVGIGIVFWVAVGLWCLVDLFLIPGMVADHKTATRTRFRSEVAVGNQPS